MITIFNRKELLTTMDMEEQEKIRTILSNAAIDYKITTRSLRTSAFPDPHARLITPGMKQGYEYTFYVKNDDYDQASYLINQ